MGTVRGGLAKCGIVSRDVVVMGCMLGVDSHVRCGFIEGCCENLGGGGWYAISSGLLVERREGSS